MIDQDGTYLFDSEVSDEEGSEFKMKRRMNFLG